jgi:hypothetical protein
VAVELFHADRQMGMTDTMKLIVAFHNFASVPKEGFVKIGALVNMI